LEARPNDVIFVKVLEIRNSKIFKMYHVCSNKIDQTDGNVGLNLELRVKDVIKYFLCLLHSHDRIGSFSALSYRMHTAKHRKFYALIHWCVEHSQFHSPSVGRSSVVDQLPPESVYGVKKRAASIKIRTFLNLIVISNLYLLVIWRILR
jgi:hypothetical protein